MSSSNTDPDAAPHVRRNSSTTHGSTRPVLWPDVEHVRETATGIVDDGAAVKVVAVTVGDTPVMQVACCEQQLKVTAPVGRRKHPTVTRLDGQPVEIDQRSRGTIRSLWDLYCTERDRFAGVERGHLWLAAGLGAAVDQVRNRAAGIPVSRTRHTP